MIVEHFCPYENLHSGDSSSLGLSTESRAPKMYYHNAENVTLRHDNITSSVGHQTRGLYFVVILRHSGLLQFGTKDLALRPRAVSSFTICAR